MALTISRKEERRFSKEEMMEDILFDRLTGSVTLDIQI